MEMDDPWGSPWADEVQDNVQLTQSTKTAKKEQEPVQPTIPPKASSLATPQQTSSPWDKNNDGDDGDAFGAWASMPSDSTFGIDGAKDGWVQDIKGTTSQGKLEKSAINNASGSINDTYTFAEDLSLPLPDPSFGSAHLLRQPSPDPWAFEEVGSLGNNLQGFNEGLNKDGTTHSDNVPSPQAEEHQKEHPPPDSAIELLPDEEEDATPTKPKSDVDTVLEKTFLPPTEHQQELSQTAPGPQEVEPMSSTSSPSERSPHNEIPQESPRTSLDEEPERPSMPRHVSSKVQELVEHFDTLAKTEQTETANERESDSNGDAAENSEAPEDLNADELDSDDADGEDFGDFGDFEEGQSDIEETAFSQGITVTKTRISNSPRQGMTKTSTDPVSRSEDDLDLPVGFTPKSSLLDQLYPDLNESANPELCYVPDTIPYDSFASTEERKMWYRVSRYGPMRQYNTGDDEDYVRVNWPKSQVRAENLKIIGRWIEEDRMSGRVVLGGGSKAGSLFGWNDTKTRPASIAAAFAERKPRRKLDPPPLASPTEIPREWPKGLARERSTSKGRRSSSKARRQSSSKSVTSLNDLKHQKESPVDVANFSWNTESDNRIPKISSYKSSGSVPKIASNTKSPSPIQTRPSRSPQSSINNPTNSREGMPRTKLETIFSPPLVKPHVEPVKVTSAVAKVLNNDDDDDDDEWGEMVSSPAVAVTPTLPVPGVMKHNKSQSLSEKPLPDQPLSKAKLPNEQAHQHRVSFDQILTPQFVGPLVSDVKTLPIKTTGESIPDPMSTSIQPAKSKAAIISASVDSWASADFSIFESPSTSALVEPNSTTILDKPKSTKILPISGGQEVTSPSNTIINNTRRSREEIEQDKIIKGVLTSLPDLSYMLKR